MRSYSRLAFWIVKCLMLFFLFTCLWNIAKESGREEIRQNRAFQAITNGSPVCIWGDVVYSATQLDTRKMQVKIKR